MLPIDTTKFTPTERAILELLSDGKAHHRDAIRDHCDIASSDKVSFHVRNIRKKIERVGQAMPCILINRRIHYQHFVMLNHEE